MDIKRIVLWVVFSMSLLILWDNWMRHNGKQSMFFPTPSSQQAASVSGAPATSAANAALPTSSAGNAVGTTTTPTGDATATAAKGEEITVTTDLVKAEIDTLGGTITHLELLQHQDNEHHKPNVVLFDDGVKRIYLAQTGLLGGDFPNHKTLFTVKPGPRNLDGNNQVQVVLEAEKNGIKLTKTYTFKKGDYVIDVKHEVTNLGTAPVTPSLYLQLVHDGTKPEKGSMFTGTKEFYDPAVYTEADHFQKLNFEKIENGTVTHATKANNGWVAVIQHFFVSAFIPQDKVEREIFTKKVDTNLYAVGTIEAMPTIAPGATVTNASRLYSGPQTSTVLETIAPGLELVKDYGILTVIAKPLFWLMEKIHSVVGNWGWTIILFTLTIKLALFPLSAAGYKGMARMKILTPKMTALRERFKDEPQKLNQAMMELYKTEKINPLGGCLPIVIQMPVFFSLYWVLQASVEMRGAPWMGWITDLTAPDPWYILPAIYAASTFVTAKLNPTPADPMQAKMSLYMPLMFSVMFFFFPSGLVLYWVVNNILSIAQQWFINNKLIPKPAS